MPREIPFRPRGDWLISENELAVWGGGGVLMFGEETSVGLENRTLPRPHRLPSLLAPLQPTPLHAGQLPALLFHVCWELARTALAENLPDPKVPPRQYPALFTPLHCSHDSPKMPLSTRLSQA